MKEASYICSACNRVPNSADWGQNGLICYGSCNSISIYDPNYRKIGKVTKTLHKHTGRVNIVRWLKKNDFTAETELLSGSTDGTAAVWSRNEKNSWDCVSIEDGNPLTIADGIYLRGIVENDQLLLCTGSTEGTFVLWHRDTEKSIRKVQNLSFGRRIPTAARFSFVPRSDIPLVAIAVDDCSIQIFCRDTEEEEISFIHVQTVQNHEDWITCMDFTWDTLGDCHLVTGSQDTSIRLWKIFLDNEDSEGEQRNECQRRIKRFQLGNLKYGVTLESILSGHENWVYGVHWCPFDSNDLKNTTAPLALLSCAMDKSMIIWQADTKDGGVWREALRVGEVGGNSLGFYGCKYAPDGLSIMAHGFQGSFHIWSYNDKERTCVPRPGPTGHFSGVVDLCWDPKGRFLISASTDQTTRIHAPWKTESGDVWHEISRPQVHGYDLSCLAILDSYTFASGAEEKVVRVFTAPKTFQKYLSTIASTEDWHGKTMEEASVPALGLTNKAVFEENSMNEDLDYGRAPTEEELIRHTLWPELQKLYGHGYEIFSIASRSDGKLFATACKSANAEHSAIIIWSTETWSQVQKLSSHRLTVTQMAFSPDNKHLVAVSRDRRFTLHRCNENYHYEIVATSSKNNPLHARIIWCCAWTHDSKFFATGSRDGRIGVWNVEPENVDSGNFIAMLEIKDSSITALAFAPSEFSHDSYILAIGFDDGRIDVRKIIFNNDATEWRIWVLYDSSEAHHSTVRKIAFRPHSKNPDKILQFASCGMDHTVKIHDLCVEDLNTL